jgi:hypothetical protein
MYLISILLTGTPPPQSSKSGPQLNDALMQYDYSFQFNVHPILDY